jgi:hypothetical protein
MYTQNLIISYLLEQGLSDDFSSKEYDRIETIENLE